MLYLFSFLCLCVRKTNLSKIKGRTEFIGFRTAIANIGNAMNVGHGVFTAPVAGFYHFMFYGLKDNSTGHLFVHLLHVRSNKPFAFTPLINESPICMFPFSCTLTSNWMLADQVRAYADCRGKRKCPQRGPAMHVLYWIACRRRLKNWKVSRERFFRRSWLIYMRPKNYAVQVTLKKWYKLIC